MLPWAWAPPSVPAPAALNSLRGMRRVTTCKDVRLRSGRHSLTAPDWRHAFRQKAIEFRGAPRSRASTTGQREDSERWSALSLPEKLLQPVQLVVAIWLLLLLPAGLASSPRRICGGFALGSLPFEYLIFFSVGTLPRAWRYGRYAKPPDSSGKPGTRRSDFALFLLCVLIAHATAAFGFVSGHQIRPWDGILRAVRLSAIVLTALAAWHLGRNYDRVAASSELVTTGPYKLVRHPIYLSYLLLFAGSLLYLQSFLSSVILLAAATVFYSRRIPAEEEILRQTFGERWDAFCTSTPARLLPLLY